MRSADHPLRHWAVNEMHLRRFAPVSEHCEILQSVRLLDSADRLQEDCHLTGDRPAFDDWILRERFASGSTASGVHFLWERHSEATTVTLILPSAMPVDARRPYVEWMEGWAGPVVRATRVLIEPDPDRIEALVDQNTTDRAELVCSDISGGLRIWSDFGIREDGYGRLIVLAGTVSPTERGRIVQPRSSSNCSPIAAPAE